MSSSGVGALSGCREVETATWVDMPVEDATIVIVEVVLAEERLVIVHCDDR